MTLQQLASLILAPSFAVTMTAILRKLAPRIDGPALVWGVAVFLSTIGSVLLALTVPYTAATIATAVVSGIVTGIMGCGAVQVAQEAAKKGAQSLPIRPPSDETITALAGLALGEGRPIVRRNGSGPLDRDTTPTSKP